MPWFIFLNQLISCQLIASEDQLISVSAKYFVALRLSLNEFIRNYVDLLQIFRSLWIFAGFHGNLWEIDVFVKRISVIPFSTISSRSKMVDLKENLLD